LVLVTEVEQQLFGEFLADELHADWEAIITKSSWESKAWQPS